MLQDMTKLKNSVHWTKVMFVLKELHMYREMGDTNGSINYNYVLRGSAENVGTLNFKVLRFFFCQMCLDTEFSQSHSVS